MLPKMQKLRAPQEGKMAVLGASKWSKLISRKICVVEKSWNFHIVYSQLGCPGLYTGVDNSLWTLVMDYTYEFTFDNALIQ